MLIAVFALYGISISVGLDNPAPILPLVRDKKRSLELRLKKIRARSQRHRGTAVAQCRTFFDDQAIHVLVGIEETQLPGYLAIHSRLRVRRYVELWNRRATRGPQNILSSFFADGRGWDLYADLDHSQRVAVRRNALLIRSHATLQQPRQHFMYGWVLREERRFKSGHRH